MRHRGRAFLLEGQARLRPIERFDPAIFINAEHNSTIRRGETETDDFGDVFPKRVVLELESLEDVGFQPGIGPASSHTRSRNNRLLGYLHSATLRGVRPCLLHGLRYHLQTVLMR